MIGFISFVLLYEFKQLYSIFVYKHALMSGEHLKRNLGLFGLIATGISSMIGASIYIVPFQIQKTVPGIGPYVGIAFIVAAIPSLLAALSYAILSSAMPRAGGTYIYASRSMHPFWGFAASFSQWFGLSIVMGVVAYMVIPFFNQMIVLLVGENQFHFFEQGHNRLWAALFLLWFFVFINIRGIKTYQVTVISLVIVTFLLSGLVIYFGLSTTRAEFIEAVSKQKGIQITTQVANWNIKTIVSASAILFASFIGFDAIAQAGGEAKNPTKNLPRAILITIILVGLFYIVFTYSIYQLVPWNFIAQEAIEKEVSAPSLLSYMLPKWWSFLIMGGACIALLKDLPSMILSVSRLVFAWSKDALFPKRFMAIHSTYQSPYQAILFSGLVATSGIVGTHFASDIFLGIDIMVISMLANFILICIAVLSIPKYNPVLAAEISIFKNIYLQKLIAGTGVVSLTFFLILMIEQDVNSISKAWYFYPSLVWLIVMVIASVIFFIYWSKLQKTNTDLTEQFKQLPQE
jgi:amino acid transporter